jgi:hypothetical protein
MAENKPVSLATSVLADGMVKLSISQGDQQGEFVIENSLAGVLAGMLLQCARESFVKAGQARQPIRESASQGPSRLDVLHTNIGIAQSQMPDCESLVFEFGKAAVGFPIPRRFLAQLAQALAAASAKGTTH